MKYIIKEVNDMRCAVTPRGGVCGLKCVTVRPVVVRTCHTPWRGVWIEIGYIAPKIADAA